MEACGGDDDLQAEIATLLSSYAVGPLDAMQAEVPGRIRRALPTQAGRGSRIGPYRLLDRIGRGGHGIVFLAERDDPQQRVALKVLRSGLDAPELIERFLAERQILARLDHPHITRLLDAGITPAGLPFFTMEYVDGVPIDRYCDRAGLTVPERLRLFLGVCEAMRYAHRHLIVHRDLKPSNILVTRNGTVKVLDFGIAKLLDESEASGATLTGQRWLTPEYASPEQIRGEAVTTASDVYGLGVVLYRLLTGRSPYDVREPSRHRIERAVLEVDPKRPSTLVHRPTGRTAAEPDGASRALGVAPRKLRRQLAGDLDRILLKALDKEPERRYAMAGELADDLRRHLGGRPVRARPHTPGYRLRKFLRRNAVPVAVVALLFIVVGGSAITTARQARRAARERDRAEEATRFLTELFRVSNPREARGDEVTARVLLDRASERIELELAGQPDLQAAMMVVMGRAYRGIGLSGRAETLFRSTLALRPDLNDGEHPHIAAALEGLGGILSDRDIREPAAAALLDALSLRERLHGTPGSGGRGGSRGPRRAAVVAGRPQRGGAPAPPRIDHRATALG